MPETTLVEIVARMVKPEAFPEEPALEYEAYLRPAQEAARALARQIIDVVLQKPAIR